MAVPDLIKFDKMVEDSSIKSQSSNLDYAIHVSLWRVYRSVCTVDVLLGSRLPELCKYPTRRLLLDTKPRLISAKTEVFKILDELVNLQVLLDLYKANGGYEKVTTQIEYTQSFSRTVITIPRSKSNILGLDETIRDTLKQTNTLYKTFKTTVILPVLDVIKSPDAYAIDSYLPEASKVTSKLATSLTKLVCLLHLTSLRN